MFDEIGIPLVLSPLFEKTNKKKNYPVRKGKMKLYLQVVI